MAQFADHLIVLTTDQFGPFGPLIILGSLGVALILLAASLLLRKPPDPLDRLRATGNAPAAGPDQPELRPRERSDRLKKYATYLEPQNAVEYSAIRMTLLQAGYRGKSAVRIYHFAQFALGLGLLAAGALYAFVSSATGDPGTKTLALTALGPGFAGYMLPKYWVNRRRGQRQSEIGNGFPDALDMMLICVEAGQSLNQSILRVAREIRTGYPALADEFEIVSHEIKAGKDKPTVLRDMADRANVADVSSFVTVLVQSASFGTSIAEALRVYAGEMRDKRVMRAEEKANTLPTKMTLATMMLTVPPLMLILVGPSLYDIYRNFSNGF